MNATGGAAGPSENVAPEGSRKDLGGPPSERRTITDQGPLATFLSKDGLSIRRDTGLMAVYRDTLALPTIRSGSG